MSSGRKNSYIKLSPESGMMWITRVIVRKRLFMVKTSLSPRLICTIARRRLPVGFLALFMLAPVFLRSAVIELSEQQAAAQTAATTFTFAAAGDLGASSAIASLSALDRSGVAFYLALGDLDYD